MRYYINNAVVSAFLGMLIYDITKFLKDEIVMIQSMTGFGRYEYTDNGKKYIVEIKTVNHRYFDFSVRMPKKFNMFEADIRNVVKKFINRGKIELFISYEDLTEGSCSIRYNSNITSQYVNAIKEMSDEFDLPFDITVSKLSEFPEVFIMEEADMDKDLILKHIKVAVEGAVKQLVVSRNIEGENLKEDLLSKLELLSSEIMYIEERSPEIVEYHQQKLEEKLNNLLEGAGIEQSRILTEVAIFADKVCVDEEIVRLKSHINSIKKIINEEENIGRKLDFIVQEMNREANTILSKSGNLDITDHGIIIKTEIEKIREQIQNIE